MACRVERLAKTTLPRALHDGQEQIKKLTDAVVAFNAGNVPRTLNLPEQVMEFNATYQRIGGAFDLRLYALNSFGELCHRNKKDGKLSAPLVGVDDPLLHPALDFALKTIGATDKKVFRNQLAKFVKIHFDLVGEAFWKANRQSDKKPTTMAPSTPLRALPVKSPNIPPATAAAQPGTPYANFLGFADDDFQLAPPPEGFEENLQWLAMSAIKNKELAVKSERKYDQLVGLHAQSTGALAKLADSFDLQAKNQQVLTKVVDQQFAKNGETTERLFELAQQNQLSTEVAPAPLAAQPNGAGAEHARGKTLDKQAKGATKARKTLDNSKAATKTGGEKKHELLKVGDTVRVMTRRGKTGVVEKVTEHTALVRLDDPSNDKPVRVNRTSLEKIYD